MAPKKNGVNGRNPAPPQKLSTLKRGGGVCVVYPSRTGTCMRWCRISSINRLMYFFVLTSHFDLLRMFNPSAKLGLAACAQSKLKDTTSQAPDEWVMSYYRPHNAVLGHQCRPRSLQGFALFCWPINSFCCLCSSRAYSWSDVESLGNCVGVVLGLVCLL